MSWTFESSLLHVLHRVTQVAHDAYMEKASDLDITPRQFVVLAVVDAHPGASQTQVVEVSGIDRSTLAELVKRLIKGGHLKRRRAKHDARAYEVSITALGRKALKCAEDRAKNVEAVLLGSMSPTERETLMRQLAALIGAPMSSR